MRSHQHAAHAAPLTGRWYNKKKWVALACLICLVMRAGPAGWWFLFFGVMWTVALCGFVSKTLFSHRVDTVAIWIYVLLGWMPLPTIPSLIEAVPAVALWWMLVGGLLYTCGTLFLVYDDRHPLFHGVWHMFVIAGSTCHFLTIFFFVGDSL
jgi:hemolysin III